MTLTILQVADAGPVESLVVMLRAVGWDVALPSDHLRHVLRQLGCKLVLSPADLTRQYGYDPVMPLPEAGLPDMGRADVVYVDVKGHQNHDVVVRRWPNLKGRVLWYRINGGCPEVVPGCGDEVNPPCPVITPNLWYAEKTVETTTKENREWRTYAPAPWWQKCSNPYCEQGCVHQPGMTHSTWETCARCNGKGYMSRAYAMWPPFHRWGEYGPRERCDFAPLCLLHNAKGWGYGALLEPVRQLGVKVYGQGSPDGLISHSTVPHALQRCLAVVHLKSNDAPGYALYEALASACPVIVPRRLIWRCKFGELFVPGETCLTFDRETHDGLTPEDVASCTAEIAGHLTRLRDPAENRRIGEAGRERLRGLMWNPGKVEDVDELRDWLGRHFA